MTTDDGKFQAFGSSSLAADGPYFSMSESKESCCDERKIAVMQSDSDAYQKAGPVQWEVSTFGHEREAVMMAVMAAAFEAWMHQVSYALSFDINPQVKEESGAANRYCYEL